MLTRILIINGVARSGKNSFVKYLAQNFHNVKSFSTIDRVKEIAQQMGYDPEYKTDEDRAFLCDLKNIWTFYNDGILKELAKEIDQVITDNLLNQTECVITIMCREPEEIETLIKYYGCRNAVSLIVRNDEAESDIPDNPADLNVFNYEYDIVINNNGSFEDLDMQAKETIDILYEHV